MAIQLHKTTVIGKHTIYSDDFLVSYYCYDHL